MTMSRRGAPPQTSVREGAKTKQNKITRSRNESKAPDPLAVARDYIKRGWNPIPYDYGTKSPRDDGWQRQKITDANVHERFNSGKQNIGVQLGPKSNGLADVDLDCSEAMTLARHLLPSTDAIFGRESKPAAHYLYRVPDPDPVAAIGYRDEKKEMICELRLGGGGKGAQTMFPGSMHPDSERVEWESDGEPTEITCATLKQACVKIAIGTMLLRHWPLKTGRHNGALCLGGFLARAGWGCDDIGDFVGGIAEKADDEEWKDRERAARDSYEAHERGEPVAGLPKLIEYFGEDVSKQIAHILNYRETDTNELLERMNEKYCIVPIKGKVRVVTWEEERGRQVAIFYGFDDFRALLDNKTVPRGNKQIGLGSWWLYHADRRQYDGLVFKPDQPRVISNRLNLWRDWGIHPRPGSWRLLRRHIYLVLANKDKVSFKYIIKWIAWALQNPEKPAEVALVFRGGRGTGRGFVGRALKNIFGQHGIHISSRDHFVGRFNAHMMDCAFLFADEAFWPGDKQAGAILNTRITEPTLIIERKGIDVIEVDNALKIYIASNAAWVVPVGMDERRIAMFNVSEEYKQNKKYFAPLYAEMDDGSIAAMMHDLLQMDLKDWHPRDDVPQTKALHEQKEHSLSPADQWWLSLLQTGELPGPRHAPKEGEPNPRLAVSKTLFEHAHATVYQLRYYTLNQLGKMLKDYGCDRNTNWRINGQRAWQFPSLKDARAAWDKRMKTHTEWEETAEWEHPEEYL